MKKLLSRHSIECTEATWMKRDMLTFVELPVDMGLLSTSGQLRMPFSEAVKYCILGISILLLLAALGILIWQICRCFSQTYTSYPSQEDTGQMGSLCHTEQLILVGTVIRSRKHNHWFKLVYAFCFSEQGSVVFGWKTINSWKLLSSSKYNGNF